MSSSYYLCVECFLQLSFDLEVYTKSVTAADFVYTYESNESCEKHSTQRWSKNRNGYVNVKMNYNPDEKLFKMGPYVFCVST